MRLPRHPAAGGRGPATPYDCLCNRQTRPSLRRVALGCGFPMSESLVRDSQPLPQPGPPPGVRGSTLVIGLVVLMVMTVVVFTAIQIGGQAASRKNFVLLSFTAGLREFEAQRYTDAVASFSDVIEVGGNAAAWGFRGESNLKLGRTDAALADFAHAVQIEPETPAVLAGYGAALAAQGRHAEAIEQFDRALARLAVPNAPPATAVPRLGDTAEKVRQLKAASVAARH